MVQPGYALRLADGDLVILESLQTATAYEVLPADAGTGRPAVLQLTRVPAQHAALPALEVVEQGEWLGLRAPLLDGLFLQARKKAPHLVFFSPRLGVWEQWKAEPVFQGVLQQQDPMLCLTSRQASAITLSVRVWKVGSTIGSSARQPQPAPPDAGPGHALDQRRTLPAAATARALQPVPGEELPDLRVPSCSSSLQDEALELSHNVVKGYIARVTKWPLYLAFRLWRAHARAQRLARAAADEHRQHHLQAAAWAAMQQRVAEERHERHMMMLACQCWARQRARRLARALQDWAALARRSASLERLRAALQRKHLRQLLAAVMAAWTRLLAARGVQHRRYNALYLRWASRRAREALLAWLDSVWQTRMHEDVLRARHQRYLLRSALSGWRGQVEHVHAMRATATAAAEAHSSAMLAAALRGWRGVCDRRRAAELRGLLAAQRMARYRAAAVLRSWRALITATAARLRHVEAIAAVRSRLAAGVVLRSWSALVARSAALRYASGLLAVRRQRRVLKEAFGAWQRSKEAGPRAQDESGEQAAARLTAMLLQQAAASRRRALARRALSAWCRTTEAAWQLRRTALIAARLSSHAQARGVLQRWRRAVQATAAAQMAARKRHLESLLRRVARAWLAHTARHKSLHAASAHASARLRRCRVRSVFAAWRQCVTLAASRWQAAGAMRRRKLARSVLSGWRWRCGAMRDAIAALGRCRARYERQLQKAALGALRVWASRKGSVRLWQEARAQALARRALRAWRRTALYGARMQTLQQLLARRWRRRLLRSVLHAWLSTSRALPLRAHLLGAMQALLLGAGVRTSASTPDDDYLQTDVRGAKAAATSTARAEGAASAPPQSDSAASCPELDAHLAAALRLLAGEPRGGRAAYGSPAGGAASSVVAQLPALARLAARPRRRAVAVLAAWRAVAAQRRRYRLAPALLQARSRRALAAACLRAWQKAVLQARARCGAAMALARGAVHRAASECLAAWHAHARWSSRLRRACHLLLARRAQRCEAAVLRAWLAEATSTRAKRQEARSAKQNARTSLAARALRAWRLALVAAADAAATAELRCAAVCARMKRQVLLAWRKTTDLSAHHTAVCVHLLQARACRRLLARAVAAWAIAAQHERLRRDEWPLLCSTFYAWLTLVLPASRAVAAAEAKLEVLRQQLLADGSADAPRRAFALQQQTQQSAPGPGAAASDAASVSGRPSAAASAAAAVSAALPASASLAGSVRFAADTAEAGGSPHSGAAGAAPQESKLAADTAASRARKAAAAHADAVVALGDTDDSDSTSSPVEELPSFTARRRRGGAGSGASFLGTQQASGPEVAALWHSWQQHMLQAGGGGGLPPGSGPPLALPSGAGWGRVASASSLAATTDAGEAEALRERLQRLEESLQQQQQRTKGEAEAAPGAEGKGASTEAGGAGAPGEERAEGGGGGAGSGNGIARMASVVRTMMSATSLRSMSASCRPEPGPSVQVKQASARRASTTSLHDDDAATVAPSPVGSPPPPQAQGLVQLSPSIAAPTGAGQQASSAPVAVAAPPAVVHVVLHPYGAPPYDVSRPGSPTGGVAVTFTDGSGRLSPASQQSPAQSRRSTADAGGSSGAGLPQSDAQAERQRDAAASAPQAAPSSGSPGGGAASTAASSAASVAAPEPRRQQQQQRQQRPRIRFADEADAQDGQAGAQRAAIPLTPVSSLPSSIGFGVGSPTGTTLPPHLRVQLGPPPKPLYPDGAWQRMQQVAELYPQSGAEGSSGGWQGREAHSAATTGVGSGLGAPRGSGGGFVFAGEWDRAAEAQQAPPAAAAAARPPQPVLHAPLAQRAQPSPLLPYDAALRFPAGSGSDGNGARRGTAAPQHVPPAPSQPYAQMQYAQAQALPGPGPPPPGHGNEAYVRVTGAPSWPPQWGQQHPQHQPLQQQQQEQSYLQQQLPFPGPATRGAAAGPDASASQQARWGQAALHAPLPHTEAPHLQQQEMQHQAPPHGYIAMGPSSLGAAVPAAWPPPPHHVTQQPQGGPQPPLQQRAVPATAPGHGSGHQAPWLEPQWGPTQGPGPQQPAAAPAQNAQGPAMLPTPSPFQQRGTPPPPVQAQLAAVAHLAGHSSSFPGAVDGARQPAAAAAPAAGGATLAPVAPDMASLEALLNQLEARSRSAMSSPRSHRTAGAAAGGAAGLDARFVASGAASAGGHASTGVAAGGLHGLDSIDALRVRASTLSAPGAPIFGCMPHGGPGVADERPAVRRPAPSIQPAAALPGLGPSASGSGAAAGAAGGGGGQGIAPASEDEVVDAVLRRLEAASMHAQAAAAAWSAAASQAEASDELVRQRDVARLAAAMDAAAAVAAQTSIPQQQQQQQQQQPVRAIAIREPPSGDAPPQRAGSDVALGGAAAGRGAAGGQRSSSAARGQGDRPNAPRRAAGVDLLATFLPRQQQLQQQQHQLSVHPNAHATGQPVPSGRQQAAAHQQQQPMQAPARPVAHERGGGGAGGVPMAPRPPHPAQMQPPQQPNARQGTQHAAVETASVCPVCGSSGICPHCGSPTRVRQTRPKVLEEEEEPQPAEHVQWGREPLHDNRSNQDGRGPRAAEVHGGAQAGQAPGTRRVRWSTSGVVPSAPGGGPGGGGDGLVRSGGAAALNERHPQQQEPLRERCAAAQPQQQPRAEDALSVIADLAQRRGNSRLAATLAALALPHGDGQATHSTSGRARQREEGLCEMPRDGSRQQQDAPLQRRLPASAPASPRMAQRHRAMDNAEAAARAGHGWHAEEAVSRGGVDVDVGGVRRAQGRASGGGASSPATLHSECAEEEVGLGGCRGGAVFDPDPLHSPLRGVLGTCQRLQRRALLQEVDGEATVLDVVAALSPRAAVAAALLAVSGGRAAGARALAASRRD